jgi:hypothetical protein
MHITRSAEIYNDWVLAELQTLYATTTKQANKSIVLVISTTAEPDDWE